MKELIEKSKNIAGKVYENIGKIEALDRLKGAVQEGEVSILMPDGGLVDLKCMEDGGIVKKCIFDCIEVRRNEAEKFLYNLTGIFEKGGKCIEESDAEAEAHKEEAICVTEDMIKNDYEAGLTVEEMMSKYGRCRSGVYKMLQKYGLSKKTVKNDCEVRKEPEPDPGKNTKKVLQAEVPKKAKKTSEKSGMELAEYIESHRAEVMALYTQGPFSLKDLATEYSCDNKELYEILARKGLLKKQK